MDPFKRISKFTAANATIIQRIFSVIVVVMVVIMVVFLVTNSQQLREDVEDFLTGDNFKVLGEIANMQRDVLQSHVAIKELRLDASSDLKPARDRITFVRISLRILNSRADSADGPITFPPESYQILARFTELMELTSEDLAQLETVYGDANAMAPILSRMDGYLAEAADLTNDLYIQQEANRISFLTTALNSSVQSSSIMIFASASLLVLSIGVIYSAQRTTAVERQANERFRLASAAVNSAIYDWDVLRDTLVWTDGLQEVFGYPEESQHTNIAGLQSCIHPDDLELVKYTYDKACQDGENFALEHRFRTSTGVYLDVSNQVQVVRDSRGQVTRMVGSIEDITERRLMLSYQESNRAKNRLLAHVSHELKTPLSAIIGYTEIVHADVYGELNEEQRHSLDRVLINARSLLDLINSLLSQTRAEEKEDKVNLGLLAPEDVVEMMYEAVAVLAESKGLVLTNQVDFDVPPALIGDLGRLRQIVTNLAGNAVKFTETGSIHIHLHRPAENKWAFSITDTGIGISEDDQQKIFDAFAQVDETLQANTRGFGLGLSIVTQLLDDLNGTIELTSELDKGSTFTVTLPLIKRMEMS